MNVIVANNQQAQVTTLDIDVIKSISGTYSANELVEMFKNFFYSKMVLDVTAIKDYENIEAYKTISKGLEPEKIILGMPFYTRQWTIASDGTIKSRNVVNMVNTKIPTGVEKQWDDILKQYYIEYKSGKDTIKMWIEDGRSIKEKVSLVTKYNLGGTACWRKDMETSDVWTIIREELKK